MPAVQRPEFRRADFRVASDPGIEIAVRVMRPDSVKDDVPLMLVHGGGGGGTASFDSPIPGYSLAEDLARGGRIVLIPDVRGWGDSTRPPSMSQPPEENDPAVTSEEACRDIAAVADWAAEHFDSEQIDLFGWATGGHWAAMFTARTPGRTRKLAILNSLFSVNAPWAMHAVFADPDDPTRFNRSIGAYSLRDSASLLSAWNRTIPIDDKNEWRDPDVADAYARLTIERDPTHTWRDPPSVRTPTGFQRNAFHQSLGHRFWEPEEITADVLIVRGELDFWSRPEDAEALAAELVNARSVTIERIELGTHFVFLDRPERGRDRLIAVLRRFFDAED
jgi:pimeloyl-ACP methyl ester carboxylesterase